jgi:hypothetical protein
VVKIADELSAELGYRNLRRASTTA